MEKVSKYRAPSWGPSFLCSFAEKIFFVEQTSVVC